MSTATTKRSKSNSHQPVPQRITGVVLQGGGALGAFEWGALECLLDCGITPDIVSGVSIDAINATVLCSQRSLDTKTALQALWRALTTPLVPFAPEKVNAQLSVFGNPGMYEPRIDYYNLAHWTSYYDTSPLDVTLTRLALLPQLTGQFPDFRTIRIFN
jgi:NTE family protein